MAGTSGAPGTAAPVSRLHEHQSFDVADFPVPTGREEEWRFTPLRRLRGLPGDDPLAAGKVTVETDPAPGVSVESVDRQDQMEKEKNKLRTN
jgi:Fe-S cluster assembly protein SufD